MGSEFSKLTVNWSPPWEMSDASAGPVRGRRPEVEDNVPLREVGGFIRRHLLFMMVITALACVLGAIYVKTATPLFTASARLVIDPQQARLAADQVNLGALAIESAEVESQVEIMKSEPVSRAVVEKLRLTEDPELLGAPSLLGQARSLVSRLLSVAPEEQVSDDSALLRRTVASFQSRLSAYRVGQSYVIQLGFVSADPEKAALIANTVAETYIASGMRLKSDATRVGAAWLDERLIEIGMKANAAAQSVEDFRRENEIAISSQSSSLEERQLVEINDQRLAAQSEVAAETARLATVDEILAAGDFRSGYIDEALRSVQISRVRSDLLSARFQLDQLLSRYGPEGAAVVAKQDEIARLESEIQEELVRIRQTYYTNLESAKLRDSLLETSFNSLINDGSSRDTARVHLAELESRARTYRTMYESLLLRLTSTIQQESFPFGDSRLVSAATIPLGKSAPQSTLILAMSAVLGGCLALVLAGLRELLDRRIRSPHRLFRTLGLPFLGRVPRTRFTTNGLHERWTALWSRRFRKMIPLHYSLSKPYSDFTEELRTCKVAIDSLSDKETRVIGITSAVRGEGKTTIACNLAQMYSAEGFRTLLIDADFQKSAIGSIVSGFGKDVAGEPAEPDRKTVEGLPEVFTPAGPCERRFAVGQHVMVDGTASSGLEILTADNMKTSWNSKNRYEEMMALHAHIRRARGSHEVIVCDMPALEETADAELIAGTEVDRVVLVIGDHRKVSLDRLARAVKQNGRLKFDIVGVIFNKWGGRHAYRF